LEPSDFALYLVNGFDKGPKGCLQFVVGHRIRPLCVACLLPEPLPGRGGFGLLLRDVGFCFGLLTIRSPPAVG
jgi:hypothetical protein